MEELRLRRRVSAGLSVWCVSDVGLKLVEGQDGRT